MLKGPEGGVTEKVLGWVEKSAVSAPLDALLEAIAAL